MKAMLRIQFIFMAIVLSSGQFLSQAAPPGGVVKSQASGSASKAPSSKRPVIKEIPQINWQSDYGAAMRIAKAEKKMLLVLFLGRDSTSRNFEVNSLTQSGVADRLQEYVCVKATTSTKITVKGKQSTLLGHSAFSELHGGPGFAIVDLAHEGTPYYERVVTAIPFQSGKYYRYQSSHFPVALSLPEGTLTQRTMVFAVRIHPESPSSAQGEMEYSLRDECRSHSQHQASIRVQGHHRWESRFHRIGSRLGRGLRAQEVVAESWPGENLVDACVDCVDSWRQSPGHWSAVRADQQAYAYDIRLASNGIWYATGIFGNYR